MTTRVHRGLERRLPCCQAAKAALPSGYAAHSATCRFSSIHCLATVRLPRKGRSRRHLMHPNRPGHHDDVSQNVVSADVYRRLTGGATSDHPTGGSWRMLSGAETRRVCGFGSSSRRGAKPLWLGLRVSGPQDGCRVAVASCRTASASAGTCQGELADPDVLREVVLWMQLANAAMRAR
jgi:hypothetical protein